MVPVSLPFWAGQQRFYSTSDSSEYSYEEEVALELKKKDNLAGLHIKKNHLSQFLSPFDMSNYTVQYYDDITRNFTISVKSSSKNGLGEPVKTLQRKWGGVWQSENAINSWIVYCFQNGYATLEKYTIFTHRNGRDGINEHFLRSWVIEGRNSDEDEWEKIDEHNHDLTMHQYLHGYSFDCIQVNPFNQIRIRNTGTNSSNDYHLTFSEIIFSGYGYKPIRE